MRLDCTGRYGGLAMLWHDQTKVGRYDQAIRIPESLFQRLAARRETTVSRFIARHGHAPAAAERAAMALFPGRYRNPDGPPRSPTSGSTCGSRPGSTSSTSAAGFPTRPGTRWPPACCGTA